MPHQPAVDVGGTVGAKWGKSDAADPTCDLLVSPLPLMLTARIRTPICCSKGSWPNVPPCSGVFVTAVAALLSFTFQGDADAMVGAIQAQPWNYLGNDLNAAAAGGNWVVAGLTSGELSDTNGHVVIIVRGNLVNGKYPQLYCGSLKPSIRLPNSSINYPFAPSVRDTVHYGWIALP